MSPAGIKRHVCICVITPKAQIQDEVARKQHSNRAAHTHKRLQISSRAQTR